MGKPDVDETEVAAGAAAITREYGRVIGANQARNIAYQVLVAARFAKGEVERETSKAITFHDHIER